MTTDLAVTRLFKIHTGALWEASEQTLAWAPIDREDGFLHLSTERQVRETARLHFAGQTGLWLIEVAPRELTDLRFEASRGGDLFPHVYGAVPRAAVVGHWPLAWDADAGDFAWPEGAALEADGQSPP